MNQHGELEDGSEVVTAQTYLNAVVVAGKSRRRDYAVQVSELVLMPTGAVRLLLDGHHSLAAAVRDGMQPYVEYTRVVPLFDDDKQYRNVITHERVF